MSHTNLLPSILDICRLSHGSCFVYYSPELLPSRDPSTNRKMIEKDRTFSRFALSFYSYYTSAATVSSPGTICIEILYIEGTKYRRLCKWARPW